MIGQQQHSRCPQCRRILFLTEGRLPAHRVPHVSEKMPSRGQFGSVPLTGLDQPWCRGSGE